MLSRSFLLSSFTACAVAASTFTSTAHAQVETTPETEPAERVARVEPEPASSARQVDYWYGWQTLLADGASVATMVLGGTTQSSAVGLIGLGGYFAGAPIVHGVQGRVGVAFASFGLRLGIPTLGAVVGYAAAGPCSASEHDGFFGCSFHGWAEAGVGALIGAGTAVAIDAAVLAHGKRSAEPETPRDSVAPRVTGVAPNYDPRTRTASMGLAVPSDLRVFRRL